MGKVGILYNPFIDHLSSHPSDGGVLSRDQTAEVHIRQWRFCHTNIIILYARELQAAAKTKMIGGRRRSWASSWDFDFELHLFRDIDSLNFKGSWRGAIPG
jgi:hypothetical protein